jgi:hypothetical protein
MAQSLSRPWTHLIFSTKNRFPFLSDKTIRSDMHSSLAKMLRQQNCETLIVNGVEKRVTLKVFNLTLKAFANSSPGLRFGNPGETALPIFKARNPEKGCVADFSERKS